MTAGKPPTKLAVRTRFAPSPTGALHIGGVRTALFNYLYAKRHGGTFLLRLEDTDRERFVPEGVGQIMEVLEWVGLIPDEGIWQGEHRGDCGPYIQSERVPHYQDYAEKLLAAGLAYRSYISTADFAALRSESIAAKRPFVYRRKLELSNSEGHADSSLPIRLDIVACLSQLGLSAIVWEDEVRGKFVVDGETLDDFVIVKADGFPTYNFANIIDDHLMQISHVLRGDEFISSTAKHALLYDALGFDRPVWAHLPVILGADGAKLSKRHGDTDALQYREKGYLPEALINFLSLLGWNDGTEKEIFSLESLVSHFSLERVQKSPAKFDLERLNWLNGLYIREQLSQAEYLKKALASLQQAGLPTTDLAAQASLLERERIKSFAELPTMIDFFFELPDLQPTLALLTKKATAQTISNHLKLALDALATIDETVPAIESALRQQATDSDLKIGDFFSTIRVSITGRTAAPGLFETIQTLGLAESRQRLQRISDSL